MTDGSRVLVALRVPVPAAHAFAAFTEEIGRWWQPNILFPFTEGPAGRLAFEPGPAGRLVETSPGGEVFVVGQIRLWEPPHRLVVGWRHARFAPDEDTELRVSFDEIHDDAPGSPVQTRVTVEHVGWDRLSPEHPARHGFPLAVFQLRFAEWWRSLLRAFATVGASP
jgi:uncharacterized protein YndB with AHSA1/START domain